jgi:hypothetical protein
MASTGYSCTTEGTVALAVSTAKSVIGVSGPASFGVDLQGYELAFDGVTASAIPVTIEVCKATFATNGPGTNSTSVTVLQDRGRTITPGFTAAKNWTTEPTVLTVIKRYTITPNGGAVIYDWPLERSPDNDVSTGFVIRLTATAIVNVNATLTFGRC